VFFSLTAQTLGRVEIHPRNDRLIKERWAFGADRITVRVAHEWREAADSGFAGTPTRTGLSMRKALSPTH